MPIDKTDEKAFAQIKEMYGNDIVEYKYKTWKEQYLGKAGPTAFCTGITRYRKCYKVSHVILRDGRKIPVRYTPSGEEIKGSVIAILVISIILFLGFLLILQIN
ncbi:hypothetical protein BHU72_11800 [Desulfuribacillus stibiiarsenatis]|uniref:Uncharacterized protein n=1 Tax=Desulfuribacillus stibiiarsenatis TaxID=1390249 RepID=A0A1E5L8D9_9FIRM|nr:hypothetical protein [Desulfuribacillus stibiiarsenatis]OEH86213.1 hypothetical protein BHU72_11800 [Desulfuribacillus stibiiarsenatis]